MSEPLIISVSGLRGVVGETLTPEVACRYALAFAAELPAGDLVIGRDGRASGPMFAEAMTKALSQAGRRVVDLGAAATPTVGVMVRHLAAAGGIQISASHNPPQYNGLKLFSAAGRVIPAGEGQRVLVRYEQGSQQPALAAGLRPAGASSSSQLHQRGVAPRLELGDGGSENEGSRAHLELVTQVCDVEQIRSRRFRVLLDANHGAGGVLGSELLRHLRCDAMILGGEPHGQFAHPPEPTETNLASVLQHVAAAGADVGFCQDPDADRLAIIDERGRYIGEEKTLAICVDHVLRTQRQGPVVTNCSTSRMTEDLARHYGVPFYRSKVGEANVVDMMLAQNAVLGGEGNGGVIDPRVGLVRDSFVGMALVLDAMASRGVAVSQLADELPQYAIHKATISVAQERVSGLLDALEREFAEATADRLDGLRLDWPSGAWLLVRPSNTEPIVRAIAEARTIEEARRLCEAAAAVIA